jgi:hypothetical protein
LPFITHDLLCVSNEPGAYLLLQLLRKYINVDIYLSLHVDTTSTIEQGKEELASFAGVLKVSEIIF